MEFKRIEKGAFRKLGNEECRVLFIRHAKHKDNITLPEEFEKLVIQGQALKEAGIEVAAAISSPADRAITAVYATKVGLGSGGYTRTEVRLADLKIQAPELVKELKEEAKKRGIPAEKYIFEMCQKNQIVAKLMLQRGYAGAYALKEVIQKNPGKTILAGSHGGSRMEIVIACLREPPLLFVKTPEIFLKRGQICELIINLKTGEVAEENYLEPPR